MSIPSGGLSHTPTMNPSLSPDLLLPNYIPVFFKTHPGTLSENWHLAAHLQAVHSWHRLLGLRSRPKSPQSQKTWLPSLLGFWRIESKLQPLDSLVSSTGKRRPWTDQYSPPAPAVLTFMWDVKQPPQLKHGLDWECHKVCVKSGPLFVENSLFLQTEELKLETAVLPHVKSRPFSDPRLRVLGSSKCLSSFPEV